MFQDKKILFFSANFFGYEREIKNKLSQLGANVDFYNERPKNSFWYKALIRINKKILKRRIEKYYRNIIASTLQKNYDYVFFLKAEVITLKLLHELKENQKQAKYILYMWDSIKNCESVKELLPEFDKILTFDRNDAKRNPIFIFRPLFYLDDYMRISEGNQKPIYDISFIGTGHTDRFRIVLKIKEFCMRNNFSSYFFIYLQDIKVYWVKKIFDKEYRKHGKRKNFSFSPLSKQQVLDIIQKSKCVLDIERSVQTGLTMRTIEVLGAKKKLITTNEDIKHYDFYHENNILIINRNDPKIDISFFKENYNEINEYIYKKYSLTSWLSDVFIDS